jgi:hypothetical protein
MSSIFSSTHTLVNIGTHSVALYIHGPDLGSLKDPVVLFISGVASSSLNWAAVLRQFPPSLRSYTYERSGYRNPELSPLVSTAENVALGLSLLIKKAPIPNPLIIVDHSCAGVLLNEFIVLTGSGPHIADLMLVDTNHQIALQLLKVNDSNLQVIAKGVEPYFGGGVEAEHKLTLEERDAFKSDEATEKNQLMSQKEDLEYAPSFETLHKRELAKMHRLVRDKPFYVIRSMPSRDWNDLYRAGVDKVNGTEEQRSHVRELIRTADEKGESLVRQFRSLSTKNKLAFASESGHLVQLTQANIVVGGVQ